MLWPMTWMRSKPVSSHSRSTRVARLGRGEPDVGGERAVVDRQHPPETAAAQAAPQHREDRPVVDHAVHQQDRRPGRLDVADDQTALHRRQPRQVAALVAAGAGPLAGHPERVERGVRRHPGHLDGSAAQAGGGEQAGRATTQPDAGPPDPLPHPRPLLVVLTGRVRPRVPGTVTRPYPATGPRTRRIGSVTLSAVSTSAPVRVVVAKPGLDGHDRGAKVVARALRDAGVEVVYTGLHQTPEQIVETAIQEDADAIGLSVLSGAHMTLFKRVIELLRERESDDIVVFGGGIVPEADMPELTAMGVAKVFTPGATTGEIVSWVRENLGERSPA